MIAWRWIVVLCSLWSAVACTSGTRPDFSEFPDDDSESGLVSIAYLKSRCKGLSTTIKSDISIKGTVAANDLYGEFYKTIVLVDASGGVEVSIDRERLCVDFPQYSDISITCNGLAVGRVGGKVVLGAQPTGEFTTDRIAERDISKYIQCLADDTTSITPRRVAIDALAVEHISDCVLFEGVRFADDEVGLPWCELVDGVLSEVDRHVVDAAGNRLIVRVSPYSSYATEKIPSGVGALCGIVEYSGNAFALRITNHEIYF